MLSTLCFQQAFTTVTVLFSPEDHPTEKLVALLLSAKKRIYAAVYMITDKKIVNELIQAKRDRNVDVQIITDKISMDTSWGRGKELVTQGIPVFVFTGDPVANVLKKNNAFINSIMHHKFAVIDNVVWCGSFNWTRSADQFNREDIIITNDKGPRDRYVARFNDLKTVCEAQPVITSPASRPLKKKPLLMTATSLARTMLDFFRFPTFSKRLG